MTFLKSPAHFHSRSASAGARSFSQLRHALIWFLLPSLSRWSPCCRGCFARSCAAWTLSQTDSPSLSSGKSHLRGRYAQTKHLELLSETRLTGHFTCNVFGGFSCPHFLPTQILSEWFGRSVIRSCVKLSYDHAQSMIEAPEKLFLAEELPPTAPEHPIDEIHRAVLNLHSIAKNLRAQRFSGGALRLDQVGSHTSVPDRGEVPPRCRYVCLFFDFALLFVSAQTFFHLGQRDHDASRLLRLPVQRQQQVGNTLHFYFRNP